MYPIIVDVHEPEIVKLQLQRSLKVIVRANEPQGLADYYWNSGRIEMWERKKAHEFLSNIGGRLDKQLVKYKERHPNAAIGIIQEGLITPANKGRCQVWRKTKSRGKNSRPIFVPGPVIPFEYTAYRAYIYQRSVEGIPTIVTEDELDTGLTLSAMVYNSMKSAHEGLARNVVIKIKPKEPYVMQLMGHPGIGEVTARKLIVMFKTPWNIYKLSWDALAEFSSERIADSIFRDIGRDS